MNDQDFVFAFEGGERAGSQMQAVLEDLMAVLAKHGLRGIVESYLKDADGDDPYHKWGTLDFERFEDGVLVARNVDHDYDEGTYEELLETEKQLSEAEETGDWSFFERRIHIDQIQKIQCW